jgi:ADP-ribosylglycohydrolase
MSIRDSALYDKVFALEMAPCALTLSLNARGVPTQAVIGADTMGRDADTIDGMAGGLTRVLAGAKPLPVESVDNVVRASPEPNLPQLAAGLCHVLVEQEEGRQRSAQAILSQT